MATSPSQPNDFQSRTATTIETIIDRGHQSHPLPLKLDCRAGQVSCERFGFGKFSITQHADGGVMIDMDADPAVMKLKTTSTAVKARINGLACDAARDAQGLWTIGTAARQ